MVRLTIIPRLDVQRIVAALATNASDFGLRGQWLQHKPTGHSFEFTPEGRLKRVRYQGWVRVPITPQQEMRLVQAFAEWKRSYWVVRPIPRAPLVRVRPEAWVADAKEGAAILAILAAAFVFLMAEEQFLEHVRGPSEQNAIAALSGPTRAR